MPTRLQRYKLREQELLDPKLHRCHDTDESNYVDEHEDDDDEVFIHFDAVLDDDDDDDDDRDDSGDDDDDDYNENEDDDDDDDDADDDGDACLVAIVMMTTALCHTNDSVTHFIACGAMVGLAPLNLCFLGAVELHEFRLGVEEPVSGFSCLQTKAMIGGLAEPGWLPRAEIQEMPPL